MKPFLAVVAVLALLTPGAAAGHFTYKQLPSDKELDWPDVGTPYTEARAKLLKQGLIIAPDKPVHPDEVFPECDRQDHRWESKTEYCEAWFLETNARGWQHYVVVDVNLDTRNILRADYPSTPEGHPSIPPPLANDVPQLKGPYLVARQQLRRLGFKPARFNNPNIFHTVDTDETGKHSIKLSEATCSGTGFGMCEAFWIAKNGRVLNVTTIWEVPQVYYVEWSSRKELRRAMRN